MMSLELLCDMRCEARRTATGGRWEPAEPDAVSVRQTDIYE